VSQNLLVGQAVKLEIAGATPPQAVMGVLVRVPPPEVVVSLGQGVPAPRGLVPGANVVVSFTTDEVFAKATTKVTRVLPDRLASVALEPFAKVDTSTRRRFFRVPASLLTLLVVSSARGSEVGKKDARALTQDVSAGGMRVETVLALAIGDRVQVSVETPRGLRKTFPATMVCEAEVVHATLVMRKVGQLYSAGLQFVLGADSEQERWLRLTFDLQRGGQLWKK